MAAESRCPEQDVAVPWPYMLRFLLSALFLSAVMQVDAAPKKTTTSKKTSSEDSSKGTAAPKKKSTTQTTTKKATTAESKPEPKPEPKPEKKAAAVPRDNAGDDAVATTTEPNATLDPTEIAEWPSLRPRVQEFLRRCLVLTRLSLTYRYGSHDPREGGMDCSGTIYYILRGAGFDAPRDASGMYVWAQDAGTLQRVTPTSLDDPSLAALRPGDLLFWEGTYNVQRNPPTSHVMIYLGTERATGAPVMVGASDGRSYRGKRRNGVSVFDFKLPKAGSTARFVAFARIPGL